jgi:hypothetical protein
VMLSTAERRAGNFKILNRPLGLGVMARTSRELAIAHGAQLTTRSR